jgi:hypothetical protein
MGVFDLTDIIKLKSNIMKLQRIMLMIIDSPVLYFTSQMHKSGKII